MSKVPDVLLLSYLASKLALLESRDLGLTMQARDAAHERFRASDSEANVDHYRAEYVRILEARWVAGEVKARDEAILADERRKFREHDAACPDHDHPPGHCRRPDLVAPKEKVGPLGHAFVRGRRLCSYVRTLQITGVRYYCDESEAAHESPEPKP